MTTHTAHEITNREIFLTTNVCEELFNSEGMLTNICEFNREFENTKFAGIILPQGSTVEKEWDRFRNGKTHDAI